MHWHRLWLVRIVNEDSLLLVIWSITYGPLLVYYIKTMVALYAIYRQPWVPIMVVVRAINKGFV